MKAKFTVAIAEELAENSFLDFFSDVTAGDKYAFGFDSHPDRWHDDWEEDLTKRNITATKERLTLIANRFEKKVSKLQSKLEKDWSARFAKFKVKYYKEKA